MCHEPGGPGCPYERHDEPERGGSGQEDDRHEHSIDGEREPPGRDAGVGDRRPAARRRLWPGWSAEPAAGPALGGIVEPDRRRRTPTAASSASDIDWPLSAARSSGLDSTSLSARRNAGLLTTWSVMSTVSRLSSASARSLLQGRALQSLHDELLRSLGLAFRDRLSLEIGAFERLGHDPLDDPMLDERPRDRFRQGPARTPSTTCSASGVASTLRPPSRAAGAPRLRASAGLSETLGAASKRSGEW